MARRTVNDKRHHTTTTSYMTSEMKNILDRLANETGDESIKDSIYFGPTSITHIRRILDIGGTIISDTTLTAEGIDKSLLGARNVEVKCFIDDPQIKQIAEQKGITRAEVAVDSALSLEGLKLVVVGSAPAALNRIIARRRNEPMNDVCVLTGASGFASAVQIKEKLIDSNIACIVIRGRKGGIPNTVALMNSILKEIAASERT